MLPPPQKKSGFAKEQQPMMKEIQRQRGTAETMDAIDILKKSAGSRGIDPVALNNDLSNMVRNNPDFRIMRANNSLFPYFNHKDGTVKVYLETADNPRTLVDSIQQFAKAMKIAGFKKGQFEIDNPKIIKAIQMAGVPVSVNSTNIPTKTGQPVMSGVMEF